MTLRKFRSGALRNKYSSPRFCEVKMCFICFSSAEKLLVIFSPALIFSPAQLFYSSMRDGAKGAHLVLSFVSRQKKERSPEGCDSNFKRQMSQDNSSFSFACPKENEPKEKGARENGPDYVGNAPSFNKEGDFNKRWSMANGGVLKNRPFRRPESLLMEGRDSIFAKGIHALEGIPINS